MNFKYIFPLFLFSFIASIHLSEAAPDISKVLGRSKTLTLDFVLDKAIQNSDSFKIIMSQAHSVQQAEYASKALTDTYITAQTGRQSGGSPPGLPYFPFGSNFMRRPNGNYYGLQTDTYFQTGTTTSVGLDNVSQTGNFQSGLHLSVSQSLLKDTFGYQTRRLRKAGLLATKAAEESLILDKDNWALDIIALYYLAWKTRSEVQAAQDHLASQQRLVNITRVRLRRGTAERADLLQTQGSLLEAQVRLSSAKEALMAIWRDMVKQINLPDEWLSFDPMQVNMSLDSEHAIKNCDMKAVPKTSSETQYWEYLKDASLLKQKAAKNAFLPDLQLIMGVSAINRGDRPASQVMKDSFSFKNTGLFVGLQLGMPLYKFKEKADLAEALAEHAMALSSWSFFNEQLPIQWQNECNQFQQLKTVVQKREANYKLQRERVTLEERRYRLGRIPLLQIIQAGNDAINSYLQLNESQIDLKLSAWRMTQISGQLNTLLNKMESQNK